MSTLTDKEFDLLTGISTHGSFTETCVKMGISKSNGGNRLRRLKDRYLKYKQFCREYEDWRKKLSAYL